MMKNYLLRALGVLSVALGALGILLPVLPTTPFLLLAAWAFLSSSDRLYNWLMNHRVFGLYIRSYIEFKGVSKAHKIFALASLWVTMTISIYLVDKIAIRILLVIIAIGVSMHLLKLKTLTRDEMEELEKMRKSIPLRKSRYKNGT